MTKAPAVVLFALVVGVPNVVFAQQAISKATTTREAVTISAIDPATRMVTIKTKEGEEDSFTAGPNVTRFNELKVGQTINITYVDSMVVQVRRPDATSKPTATTGNAAVTANPNVPGGTLAGQVRATVTVKAIQPQVPSITVVSQDGRTFTRKIEDKKNLEGIKVGDQLDITYTRAVLMNVAPAK